MEPVTLLIIAGAGFLLLSRQKTAVAGTANLTAQQRAALASQQNQNNLFGAIGKLLNGALGKSSGGTGGGGKSSGSGSGGGGSAGAGGGGRGCGPVTQPCYYCPASAACDIPAPGISSCVIGPPAPCNDPSAVYGSCVTPCTISSACQGTPCAMPCYCNICFGSGGCC